MDEVLLSVKKPGWLRKGNGHFSEIEKELFCKALNRWGKPTKKNETSEENFMKLFYYRNVSSVKHHINSYFFCIDDLKYKQKEKDDY